MNLRKTKVFVNNVEVINSPVAGDVNVEVIEDLPPLPMKEVGPFVEKPRCSHCGFKMIEWVYQPGSHNGCTLGHIPQLFWAFGVNRKEIHELGRVSRTFPPHHELTCLRCKTKWAMGVLPEVAT